MTGPVTELQWLQSHPRLRDVSRTRRRLGTYKGACAETVVGRHISGPVLVADTDRELVFAVIAFEERLSRPWVSGLGIADTDMEGDDHFSPQPQTQRASHHRPLADRACAG